MSEVIILNLLPSLIACPITSAGLLLEIIVCKYSGVGILAEEIVIALSPIFSLETEIALPDIITASGWLDSGILA